MPDWIDPSLVARYPAATILTVAAIAAFFAWIVAAGFLRGVARVAASHAIWKPAADAIQQPLRWVAAAFALTVVFHAAPADLRWVAIVRHLALLSVIGTLTWTAIALVHAGAAILALLHPTDSRNNLAARRVQTQVRVIERTLSVLIGIVGVALALISFPGVREIGASLLASAGVAGLVAGLAARPVLGNLIAGMQIALTQPLRLDDVLVVEGERGRVEEIGSAYVVLRLWDERRLVVPLQALIEKPFQNWTRQSSRILGTVFLWLDPAMPIDPLRAEALRICEGLPEWDRRVCNVQVTDATQSAVQVRVLLSAADAQKSFDLCCKVREALVGFLHRRRPGTAATARPALSDSR